jgi:hypothetical protein
LLANTFAAVAKLGTFNAAPVQEAKKDPPPDLLDDEGGDDKMGNDTRSRVIKGLRTEFVYNIQVVLPSNASEEVYLNIFNAIRRTFQ